MKTILEYVRAKEWYASKIPLAMAIYLHCWLFGGGREPKRGFLLVYAAYAVFFVAYFAFNYLINDYFDMEADRISGKKKVILHVPAPVVRLSLFLLAVVGNLPLWAAVDFQRDVLFMSAVVYVLGASYSVKGLRMKERGVWGLIVSSFAQRNSPVLMLAVLLEPDSRVFWCWMAVSFVNGLRYILIHQHIDRENDLRSGIHTYVADRGISIGGAIWCCFLIETAGLGALYLRFCFQPWFWAFLLFYLALFLLNGSFVKYGLHQSYFYSYACVPLEDLYNIYLPLILTGCCVYENGMYPLLALTVLYLWIPLRRKIGMPVSEIRRRLERQP